MVENNKKEEYRVRIGPRLRKILDKQKQLIKEATYDVCNASDYEAGEIIAKKVSQEV